MTSPRMLRKKLPELPAYSGWSNSASSGVTVGVCGPTATGPMVLTPSVPRLRPLFAILQSQGQGDRNRDEVRSWHERGKDLRASLLSENGVDDMAASCM